MKNGQVQSLFFLLFIFTFAFPNFAYSKNSALKEIKTDKNPYEWWETERLKQQKKVDNYVQKNKESYKS